MQTLSGEEFAENSRIARLLLQNASVQILFFVNWQKVYLMKPWRALKYLIAFTAPMTVWIAFRSHGWLTFLPVIYAFLVIPFLELFFKPSAKNLSDAEVEVAANDPLYDLVLYLSLPVLYYLLWLFLHKVAKGGYTTTDLVGYTLSMGLMCGIFGINVAHELGHRKSWFAKTIAKTQLLSSLYMHFFIEHNRGHHKRVGTREDPASARMGESIYKFWIRTVWFSYWSAWMLEKKRLKKAGHHFFSVYNEMIIYHLLELTLLWSVYKAFGGLATMCFLGAALMGILLLETVNYIEHYGLMRKQNAEGNYEKVMHYHSWNSDHVIGRLMLFELSRHSDHHYKASKPFQLLRHFESSPQMPTGYPGMMLLTLFPPIWFYVMKREFKRQIIVPETLST
ncbi:alkane 1-monooxygenase [soil metagenome]